MTKNLPAKIYEPYISFFEKEVEKAQEEVEKARQMEPIYLAIKEALEKTANDYPQKFTIKRFGSTLNVTATILSNQHYRVFNPLITALTNELVRRGLRKDDDGEPIAMSDYNVNWIFRLDWLCRRDANKYSVFNIRVEVVVPYLTHNIYRQETKKTRTITDDYIDYKWLDTPQKTDMVG